MSRHTILAHTAAHTVVVGWDNPLETFFAQVFDSTIDDDEEAELLWVGLEVGELPTVAALQDVLAGWATLPDAVAETLRREQGEAGATCTDGHV